MILLDQIVEIFVGSMSDGDTKFFGDRSRIRVMAVGRDAVGCDTRYFLRFSEKRLRSVHIALFTEATVDQIAVTIDGSIQVAPAPEYPDIGFINIPSLADFAAPLFAQDLGDERCEFRLPLPYRLVGKGDSAFQKHLCQVAQAQLVAKAPSHDQENDVRGSFEKVERRLGPLVESSAAALAPVTLVSQHRFAAQVTGLWVGAARTFHSSWSHTLRMAQEHGSCPQI